MCTQTEVTETVLARGERFHEVTPERRKRKDPSPPKIEQVWVADGNGERRYGICRNEAEARKGAHDLQAIVTSLREALRRGEKSLVGNKGYRRYLRTTGKTFSVDEDRIEQEARYDGTWVLRTNTTLSTTEVALPCKRLWTVEEMLRSMKSLLSPRPIWHESDETIRGKSSAPA